jgi:hypothetical protein
MIRRKLLGCTVALASVGWLVPMWLGVETYLSFWQAEAYPLLRHAEHPTNSFPYLHFASQCFDIGFLWLGVVGLCWSYVLFMSLVAALRPNNSFKGKPLRGSP